MNVQRFTDFPRPASPVLRLSLWLIEGYRRVLSPLKKGLLGPLGACRYSPSCSRYARDALLRYGLRRGLPLALKRIVACRPGRFGGYDPVPGADPVFDRERPAYPHLRQLPPADASHG
ncbi:MAG: membrane protein insertion efficiency factor YidD [Opitutales bacterium]